MLEAPLFWISIGIVIGVAVVLARPWIMALGRLLIKPLQGRSQRIRERYLKALVSRLGTVHALLVVSGTEDTSRSELTLTSAFHQITLYAEAPGDLAPRRADRPGALRAELPRELSEGREWQPTPGQRLARWALLALAHGALLALALALIAWLLWPPWPLWPLGRFAWWQLLLAGVIAAFWYGGSRILQGWLLPKERMGPVGPIDRLLIRWAERRACVADRGTPGREVWEHKKLLIRGAPGSGKTTLLKHMALLCARDQLAGAPRGKRSLVRTHYGWPECPFPFYIPLRALPPDLPSGGDLLQWYAAALPTVLGSGLADCSADFLRQQLEAGGCLVLLDAFDELRDADRRTQLGRMVAALLAIPAQRPNLVVVSSRIVGYEGQLDGMGFVQRWVSELDSDQAAIFVRTRYGAIAELERRIAGLKADESLSWDAQTRSASLIDRLPKNLGLSQLSRNPLLLSLAVAVHHSQRKKGQELPQERYRLYEQAVGLLALDWERRKDAEVGLEPTDEGGDLNPDEKLRMLRALAWRMFERAVGATHGRAHAVIHSGQAEAVLADVLVNTSGFAPERTGEGRTHFARSEAARWLQNLGQRGGVLQATGNVPGSSEEQIEFAHLTFQEYLAARAAATEDVERRSERILQHWSDPNWREVLLLYAASHRATPVVRHLLDQPAPAGLPLAGQVLVERPVELEQQPRQVVVEQLRQRAFDSAPIDEEAALQALALLEDSGAVPERDVLLQLLPGIPHAPIRRRVVELLVGRRPAAPARRDQPPAPPPPLAPDLQAALERLLDQEPDSRVRLTAGLALGPSAPPFADNTPIPTLVEVPGGPFLMGGSNADKLADSDEKPQHQLELPTYWIGKHPVTNAQWRAFVEGDGYTNRAYWSRAGWRWLQSGLEYEYGGAWHDQFAPRWDGRIGLLLGKVLRTKPFRMPWSWDDPTWNGANLPVVGVSWYEAVAYCRWLTARTGQTWYLPSEAEWEKAARGSDGRAWPWGDDWAEGRCNSEELGLNRTSPVGSFPLGVSSYGAHDMSGNVWEWCATRYGKVYPYNTGEDEWTEAYLAGDNRRHVRGGSYLFDKQRARGAPRSNPRYRNFDIGLRVARRSPGTDSES